jgi:PAS domain S-box-containing protein
MFEVSNKILCVDDQAEITQLLEQQLRGKYQVSFANSGAAALDLLSTQGPFAVILVDYAMPGMDGVTLLREVHNRAPETVSIMLTAFADVSVAVSALHEASIFRFVRKPWDPTLLMRYIDDALDRYRVTVTERNLSTALERVNQRLYEKVQELESTQRLLGRWMQMSPVVAYSATVGGDGVRLTFLGPNAEALTGRGMPDCLATPTLWIELVHPDDRDRIREQFERASADGNAMLQAEYRLVCKDGSVRRVRDMFRKIAAGGGSAEIYGAWIDIGGAGPAMSA